MAAGLKRLRWLVLLVGVGVLSSVAVAAPPATYEDASGDASQDITTVKVTANRNEVIFKISMPTTTDLTGSVILGVDTDFNTATGCPGPGWDYELRVTGRPDTIGPDAFEMGRASNIPGDCSYDYSGAQRLSGSFDSRKSVLTVVAPRDIFTADAFRFDVTSGDGGTPDFTPVWTYRFK